MALNSNLQFARYVELRIKNFDDGSITTIGNDLRIDFTFFKTIDQVNEASIGEIKIYGLTEDTRSVISVVGNEVSLQCGYAYSNIATLFIANVVQVNRAYEDSSVVCILNVSANFITNEFTKVALSETNNVIPLILGKYLIESGLSKDGTMSFIYFNVPPEYKQQVKDYFLDRVWSFFAVGSAKQVLKQIADTFQLDITTDTTPAVVSIRNGAVNRYIQLSSQPYPTHGASKQTSPTQTDSLQRLYEDKSGDLFNIITLSQDTGLLSYPEEDIKIDKVPENWKLSGTESITAKGQQTILDNQQKEIERERRSKEVSALRAERERKAIEKGKPLKPLKPKPERIKKVPTVQIKRKFIKVKALINPSVRPNSHIELKSVFQNFNGIYRVRTASFSGSNVGGDFSMSLYLEDSGNKYATVATEKDIQQYGATATGNIDETNTTDGGSD